MKGSLLYGAGTDWDPALSMTLSTLLRSVSFSFMPGYSSSSFILLFFNMEYRGGDIFLYLLIRVLLQVVFFVFQLLLLLLLLFPFMLVLSFVAGVASLPVIAAIPVVDSAPPLATLVVVAFKMVAHPSAVRCACF